MQLAYHSRGVKSIGHHKYLLVKVMRLFFERHDCNLGAEIVASNSRFGAVSALFRRLAALRGMYVSSLK